MSRPGELLKFLCSLNFYVRVYGCPNRLSTGVLYYDLLENIKRSDG